MRIPFLKRNFVYAILPLAMFMANACKTKEKPVTKDEALAMAKTIEQSVTQKKEMVLNDAVDIDLLIEKMKLGNNRGLLQAQGFRSGLKEKMVLGTIIIQSIGKKGDYKLIREYAKGDTQHLVFRMNANGNLNYHDLELAHVNGKCKIADAFIYLSGENLSETMANIYKSMGGDEASNKEIKAMNEVGNIREMMRTQDYDGAEKAWNNLPSHTKNLKSVQLIHVLVSQHLADDSAYTNALESYQTLYPNEPNMYLIEIEGYFSQRKYDKALDAINHLDSAVGHDPLLDYQRGLCYKTMENTTKEKECFENLVKNEPDFEKGYIELIAFYLRASEFDKASPIIAAYKTHPTFDMAFLQDIIDKYPK